MTDYCHLLPNNCAGVSSRGPRGYLFIALLRWGCIAQAKKGRRERGRKNAINAIILFFLFIILHTKRLRQQPN
ncbi:MAG: hypothetical protein KatS3mg105_3172 [Gemmatales bacterium]|nr:MAG: hypothetical protein KatS3mg105_3172 [Gemmatales bacterium]